MFRFREHTPGRYVGDDELARLVRCQVLGWFLYGDVLEVSHDTIVVCPDECLHEESFACFCFFHSELLMIKCV